MTALIGMTWLSIPVALAAPALTNAELSQLVRKQAQQIKRLNARIDRLEKEKKQPGKQAAAPGKNRPQNAVRKKSPPLRKPASHGKQAPRNPVYAQKGGRHNRQNLEKRISRLEKDHVKVDWSSGVLEISSPNGEHSFKINGRIQYDFSSTFGSRYDSRNITGTEFRRVRLGAEGKILDPVHYEVQADFAGGHASLTNAYLAFQHDFAPGEATLYLGNKFADRGLDARTSSNWTWFTERGTVANTIAAESSYDLGATGEFVGQDNWHASLAVYKGSASRSTHTTSDDLAIISRAHWDPIYLERDKLLHIGANGSYERFHGADNDFEKNMRIGSHYNDNLAIRSGRVGLVAGHGYRLKSGHAYGVELAGLYGPWAFGAEWGQRFIATHHGPTMDFSAYTVQVGYSLTGEPFGYSKDLGVFTHPEVAHPVFQGGWGTWQLVARYEGVDFENSSQFHGGSGHGASVGVDWYLNDWIRSIMEYTRWHTHNNDNSRYRALQYLGSDGGNTVNARIQLAF